MERGKQWVSHAVSITVTLKHCRDVLSYLKMWNQGTDTQQNTTTKSLLQTEPIWQLAGEGCPVKNTNFALLLKKQKTKKTQNGKVSSVTC